MDVRKRDQRDELIMITCSKGTYLAEAKKQKNVK